MTIPTVLSTRRLRLAVPLFVAAVLACANATAQKPPSPKAATWEVDPARPPYDVKADAKKDLAEAQARARKSGKFVMVIFGANWCKDCIVLHQLLDEPETHAYVAAHFEIVGVDLGRFDKNTDLAKQLAVNLDKGIPAAAFLASDGSSVGNTNQGELEASRNYHSDMILRFLHEVVDNRKITRPH